MSSFYHSINVIFITLSLVVFDMFLIILFKIYNTPYIYIEREREGGREMVGFGESDKMIEISGKVDESNPDNGLSSNISFFI